MIEGPQAIGAGPAPADASAERPRLRPIWARALGLVTSPRSVFEELERRPAWFWPTTITSIVAFLGGVLLFDRVVYPMIIEKMEERGLESAQMARMEAFYSSPLFKIGSSAIGAVFNFILIVVAGLALFALCSFLLGGRATVKQSISVSAQASLLHVLRAVILLPIMWAREDVNASLGPGILFPAGEATGFAGKFLSSFLAGLDLFHLWVVALMAVGMSVMSHLPTRRVAIALGAGYLALITIWSLLGAVFQPG